MSLIEDETLHMFFDPNLNPVEFVDALFLSVTKSGDMYAPANIKKASSTTQELITRLDYNTSEIVTEMVGKLGQLRKLAGSVNTIDLKTDTLLSTNTTTEGKRLEYYADILRHSVETLSEEVEHAQAVINSDQASEPLEQLSQLKTAEENLILTNSLLLNVRRTIGNLDKRAISLEKFQDQLNALQETIRTRLHEGSSEDKEELSKTIQEMKSWLPLFQPFTHFGPVFAKFISKLENEL